MHNLNMFSFDHFLFDEHATMLDQTDPLPYLPEGW